MGILGYISPALDYKESTFKLEEMPSQAGKVAIVTGSNTGVGYETAKALLNSGADVYMASRSKERAEAAIERMKQETGKDSIHFMQLDLQDLKQVQKSALDFLKKHPKLDLLVNNAGIMACPFALTKDGLETQFGTNHVGHFLLTQTLMPALLKAGTSRVVNLSSSAHRFAPNSTIDTTMLTDNKKMEELGEWTRYGLSKYANILFTVGLNKRYGDKGMAANAVHPGGVMSELARGPMESMKKANTLWGWPSFFLGGAWSILAPILLLTPAQGALSSLYAATSLDIITKSIRSKYIVPYGAVADTHFPVDEELAERLWIVSEKIVKEKLAA